MGLNPKGRDWGALVNWDDLGKFYAGFIISWTIILYSGVAWLVWERNVPFIKIRNLPLAITAISFLHVYLVKIFLAYTTNGHFLCSAEFWIMSIYLPFGIALFQANLAQLSSISEQQKKFIDRSSRLDLNAQPGRVTHLWRQWQRLSHLHKTYVLIGIGMAVQLLITGVLYGTTPTLRGDWSSYGNISHAKGQAKCRKSLQWIPSAFWQLFYSWCYGPYVLFKIRKIHDTRHWRLQVILSVLSGLPGSPLWLAALYSPAFQLVNRRWVPPMWLAPGIIVMQLVTIFFPIYETFRSRHEMKTTLAIIRDWEDSRKHLTSNSTDDGTRVSDKRSSYTSTSNVSSSRQAQMHTMAGLEKALAINPAPLLRFAATKDFTAENITFLLQVRQWRGAYSNALATIDSGGRVPDWALANLFAAATDIYICSVYERTADFPINIESKIRASLHEVFSRAVPERSTRVRFQQQLESSTATFDPTTSPMSMFTPESGQPKPSSPSSPAMPSPLFAKPSQSLDRESSSDSADTLYHSKEQPQTELVDPPKLSELVAAERAEFPHHPGVNPLGRARAKIPPRFDEHVFDAAEKSVKYLVLTNTWQKFVRVSLQSGSVSGSDKEEGEGEG